MKALIAAVLSLGLLATCSLTPAFTKTTKKKAEPIPQAQTETCAPALKVMEAIDKHFPLADGGRMSVEKGKKLAALAGVADKNFDLVVALAHQNKTFGWLFGWKKDETICAGGQVPEQLVPAFLAIVTGDEGDKGGV